MAGTIKDILEELDKDINNIKKYEGNTYLRNFLEVAFLESHKMFLPEGDPPYKESSLNEYETKGTFWQLCRKIHMFTNKGLPALKRESQFITALESLDKMSSKILLLAKDQNLSSAYPNITLSNLTSLNYFKTK